MLMMRNIFTNCQIGKKIQKSKLEILGLALLIILITIPVLIISYQATAQVNAKPTYDLSMIEFYKQGLTKVATNGNDQLGQEALQSNLKFAEQEATQYALVTPAPKNPNSAFKLSLPVLPTMVIPTGIFNHGSGVYKPSEVTITSAWQGFINGNLYQVEVGALVSDPTQGVVYYRITGTDDKLIDMGRILTPKKAGSISITNEKSGRLILTTVKGVILYFDVQAKQYPSSLNGELIPRINFPQTPTPNPYP